MKQMHNQITDSFSQTMAEAIRKLMTPLVKVLLRNGIPYGMLADLIRQTYVDVAYREFAPVGKKQTVSRVSALTGLTRKDVSRLLEVRSSDSYAAGHARYSRAVRVISGWLNDARYQDESGKPAVLPLEESDRSFALLVRQYSGDIPTMAMLAMLEESDTVTITDGKVTLVRHAYVPDGDLGEKIKILGNDVAELISTIDHNLQVTVSARHFQRKVASSLIAPEMVVKLRESSARKAQAMLEELDKEFSACELETEPQGRGKYVSLGVYYYENEADESDN